MNALFRTILLMILFVPAVSSHAQTLNFGVGDAPVEIFADNGIEWQQERLIFIARGNAKAVRGGVTVLGDELRAYYRERPDGSTEIWRLDAQGKARIVSEEGTAYGSLAVYDVDNAVLTITGKGLKLISGADQVTAKDQLEFWEKKQMAVARGDALAVREGKRLRADVLASYFRKDKAGETRMYRVDAFDNVRIVTDQDEAYSDRGVYNVESGIATLIGSVKIVRDKNVLNGCSAEVDLNTGISRLHSCATGGTRVKGVIRPANKQRN